MQNTETNHHLFVLFDFSVVLFHSEFGSLRLRKGNREFKASKQVIKDGSPGGERALKRCSEGPMLSNYMLIFKTTTTETIGAKVWKCMLEGIFLGNASLLCSYLCLEPCIWTDSIWIKIQLLYSCDDRGRDRYYSQSRQKAFWNIERFYYWSVGSQIDILWLLSTPRMTVHPSEGWYTKSMNQTNKTEPHVRSPPQRRRGCLLETLKKKKKKKKNISWWLWLKLGIPYSFKLPNTV